MKIRIAILCVFFAIAGYAKPSSEIDSLENLLEKSRGNGKIAVLEQLANLYINESSEKAFEAGYKAYNFATLTGDAAVLSDAYFTLGMLHFRTSLFDSATYYLNKALKTCETNEQSAKVLDNLGVIYKDLGRYDSALVLHNQALKLQQTLGNRDDVAVCYKNIGNVYMQMAKYDDALEYYTMSLEQRKLNNDEKSMASLYTSMSSAFIGKQKYSDALSYLTKAVAIQENLGDKGDEAYTLNGIGNLYFRLKVYDKAQEFYTKSLELRQQLGDKNDIAASQFNIATVHRDLGNNKEALKYYNQALELRQQTDNKEAQAMILNAIGGVYKNQKMYSKAIENYEKALEINKKIGSQKAIASSYERLGMVYKDTCLYDVAIEYYDKSIYEYRQIEDSVNIGRLYNFYGNLNSEKGDFKTANWCYEKSKLYYVHNELGLAYVAFNQGKLCQKYNDASANAYYQDAYAKAEQCKEKTLMRDVSYALYSLSKSQNKIDASLRYFEQYVALKDSIESDMNRERIAQMEFESDIKVLEQKNEVQSMEIEQAESKQVQFRIYMILLATILLAIAVFAMLLYRQFVQKKKALSLLYLKQQEVEKANDELKNVNAVLEKKNSQIIDSMIYARRIQKSVLPAQEIMDEVFPQNFILYMPKEIVSGDFYWISKNGDNVYFAAVDCTGHGVPGAFMSMMGNALLNQIVNEMKITSPAEILNILDKEVIKTLRQDEDTANTQEDGMAISLIRYNSSTSELVFAGAGQKMLIVSDGNLQSIPASLFSIGGMHVFKQSKLASFEETSLHIEPNTIVYLFSDGYIDQFGGEKNERFSSQRFEQMVLGMQSLDMPEQFIHLSKTLEEWKGETNQLDDILVVGIKL